MWRVELSEPWLIVDFAAPMRVLGWTPQGGGLQEAQKVLWRAVRNEDLTEDFDVLGWLAGVSVEHAPAGSPCFLTSARIADFAQSAVEVEGRGAAALATAGLGNAERIGRRREDPARVGTINLLVGVTRPLTLPAALEALSLMAEARTAAMLDHAPRLWADPPTGTGTDCLCLAWPGAGAPETYAGKHTAMGEALGRAAYEAVAAAIRAWSPPR